MAVDLTDPVAVLLAALRAFERAGLRAAAYGGLVVAMYGRPRETHDADLAVSSVSVEAARDALTEAGLTVVPAFSEVRFGGCTERDLEDAASVVEKQRTRLDWPMLEREAAALALEVPDHPVAARFAALGS